MPPKKKGRGGDRGGRKEVKGGEQGKDATKEEYRKYVREKVAKFRGTEKKPEERVEGEGSSGVGSGGKMGRPPLDPQAGPMKGEVRKEYMQEKKREGRKKEKLRKVRQAAVYMRKDRGGREELLEDSSSDDELVVSLNEEVREEGRKEGREEGRKEEEVQVKASSETNFYEKLNAAKEIMSKMTRLEKVDVTAKIMVAHDMDDEKLGLRMSPKDVKAHLAMGLSMLTPYHVRERSQLILDIVESHCKGEKMLVKLLQEEVYRDEVAASLLTAAGLQVEGAFLTKRQRGRMVAKEESVRLTSNRRSGPDRDTGVRMAIAVATRCWCRCRCW